jgi:hypothetical protein
VRTTADHLDNMTDHGIAREHVHGVFERFRRPGAPATIQGTGLGLYLSRHLVEAQGGWIDVGSPGPGQGGTFTIALPVTRGWIAADTAWGRGGLFSLQCLKPDCCDLVTPCTPSGTASRPVIAHHAGNIGPVAAGVRR